MFRGNRNTLFIVLLLICLFPAELLSQCAMCKEAAETSLKNDPRSMARSLNSGILYLMAVPYLAILFIFRKQILSFIKSGVKRMRTKEV